MGNITFTLPEVIGILGGFISLTVLVLSFFIRRTVYKEIDDLKDGKQDKPHCVQQLALCNQQAETMCEDVKEIKSDLKEGRKEFSQINKKLERVMTSMKLEYDDLNQG